MGGRINQSYKHLSPQFGLGLGTEIGNIIPNGHWKKNERIVEQIRKFLTINFSIKIEKFFLT